MSQFEPNIIHIYIDGACRNNQSTDKSITVGAFGYILHYNGKEKEFAQAQRETTSNREELNALINALLALKIKNIPIRVYPDSNYVLLGCTEWLSSWKKKGWKTADKKPVLNQDLWKWLDELMSEFSIEFIKVKGHSENEYNNRADFLCNLAMDELERKLGLDKGV